MAKTTKLIIFRALLSALLATAFVLSTSPSVNAQGGVPKPVGMGGFSRALEYGQTDEYVKLDKSGKPIYKPGTEPKIKETVTVYEDENEEITDAEPVKEGEVTFLATVTVPHMKKALTQVTAYPYPMKPPAVKQKVKLLPDKEKPLRQMMLSTGYFSRASLDIPYPPGGWRWQYAFAKAIKASDMAMPHTIFEHYAWADRMLPYIQAQTKAYNNFERERVLAYNEASQQFLEKRTEYEDVATQRGLGPVPMKRVYLRSGKVGQHYACNLMSGKWWILATHRVPGLKYYWLLPLDIDKKQRIVLNEGNAIYIEGGW